MEALVIDRVRLLTVSASQTTILKPNWNDEKKETKMDLGLESIKW